MCTPQDRCSFSQKLTDFIWLLKVLFSWKQRLESDNVFNVSGDEVLRAW